MIVIFHCPCHIRQMLITPWEESELPVSLLASVPDELDFSEAIVGEKEHQELGASEFTL